MKYRNRNKNPLIRLLIFLFKIAGICTVIFLLLLLISSFFKIKNITVESGTHYTDEEIIDFYLADTMDNISFVLYLKQKLSKQKQIPFIEKVDINIIDKNSISIQVYDKMVIGCVEFMGSYMYFDIDGRVVESSKEQIHGIPAITGLKFNRIVLYETLEVQKNNLFNVILDITKSIKKYNLIVGKVDFQPNDEVILYCDGHMVELGKQEFYDKQLSELSSFMEKLGNNKYKICMKDPTDNQGRYIAVLLE